MLMWLLLFVGISLSGAETSGCDEHLLAKNYASLGYPARIVAQKLAAHSEHTLMPTEILQRLRHLNQYNGTLSFAEQKSILYLGPQWGPSPQGLSIAKLLWTSAVEFIDPVWIRSQLREEDQKAFERFLTRVMARWGRSQGWIRNSDRALVLLSTVPMSLWPERIRRYSQRHWLDLRSFPALKSKRISHLTYGYLESGSCCLMFEGHAYTLALFNGSAHQGERTIIKVDGHVVGSIKHQGDGSLLALRNVLDENGRLVLVMGGVYHVSKDLLNEVLGKKPRVLAVEELRVQPSTFLFNSDAVTGEALGLAAKPILDPEVYSDLFYNDYLIDGHVDEVHFRLIWRGILEEMDRIRQLEETQRP